MGSEARIDWQAVRDGDFGVPTEAPLADLTAELTLLLGHPDPHQRDGIALTVLQTWIERGVYDDLLVGLGDGMAAGLRVGLDRRRPNRPGAGPSAEVTAASTPGAEEGDGVFRRSFSAWSWAECVARDTARPLVLGATVLGWADALAAWWLAETDLRGWVPGKGWAHAVAHGADAIATLARSPHFTAAELRVLLDVLGQRVTSSTDRLFVSGEPDRLALATLEVLRRDRVPVEDVELWLAGLVATGREARGTRGSGIESRDPYLATGNLEAYLRALYLQLALGPRPPRTPRRRPARPDRGPACPVPGVPRAAHSPGGPLSPALGSLRCTSIGSARRGLRDCCRQSSRRSRRAPAGEEESIMGKTGRKRRARRKKAANHGKRPNS